MNDNRIIIISHCVFNELSKVRSEVKKEYDSVGNLINRLIEEKVGFIQLPCPETYCYGLKRWGHTVEQFDNPYYRETCEKLFDTTLNMIKNHIAVGDKIVCLAGIAGSPSCGVESTCSSDLWGGELGSKKDIAKTISDVSRVQGKGVFIDVIQSILDENNIKIPMIEYNRKELGKFEEDIFKLLNVEDN
ncbi:hypothetical protein IMX26_15445 [Clostridium sp. 'deep sea']|uniref:CD3072 family TudS-related putative desulfidase n=1 Tax=Clostridium sp. 'deep sea' TaxID=2779445 RepID=UPI00189698BE|nr:CD3072 family TudS-related putative desulfidase [Clostridium sp. 'deep sea']QOR34836.1 hypothetical protein IMX26_15445 [Clostridium sp. 'deep sea']